MSSFYGSREEGFTYELLNSQDDITATLGQVFKNGTLDFSTSADARGSGSITMTQIVGVNWLSSRIRVSYVWNGNVVPLLTAIPSIPVEEYGLDVTMKVDLKDKLSILKTDIFWYSFSVAASSSAMTVLNDILFSAGQGRPLDEAGSPTLVNGRVWEPNTSKLKIINDILESIGYFSLACDGLGNFVVTPYVEPRQRPIRWVFEDTKGRGSYLPRFVRNYDPFNVPNRFIAIGKSDGTTEADKAIAADYDSDFGYYSRGFWLTETATDVEGNLTEYANRRLIESRNVYETLDVTHPYLGFGLNDRVQFRNKGRVWDAVCQKQTWSLTEGGLIKSTLRVIV